VGGAPPAGRAHTQWVDRIQIKLERREFGHNEAYDALADDLHGQGWRVVIVEPNEDVSDVARGCSVAVDLSQDVSDVAVDAIATALINRLRRPCEHQGLVRQAVISAPSRETLGIVELDEDAAPMPDE
jgi:hypothetical protein